jgi:hypothetical protein
VRGRKEGVFRKAKVALAWVAEWAVAVAPRHTMRAMSA